MLSKAGDIFKLNGAIYILYDTTVIDDQAARQKLFEINEMLV